METEEELASMADAMQEEKTAAEEPVAAPAASTQLGGDIEMGEATD